LDDRVFIPVSRQLPDFELILSQFLLRLMQPVHERFEFRGEQSVVDGRAGDHAEHENAERRTDSAEPAHRRHPHQWNPSWMSQRISSVPRCAPRNAGGMSRICCTAMDSCTWVTFASMTRTGPIVPPIATTIAHILSRMAV